MILFPDPEQWLCAHLRSRITFSAIVANEWPEPIPQGMVVIVRYDGGPQVSLTTEESAYGFTILGGMGSSDKTTTDAAREVRAIVTDCWQYSGPFADCRNPTGPARVPNLIRPERYFTATLITVGTPA